MTVHRIVRRIVRRISLRQTATKSYPMPNGLVTSHSLAITHHLVSTHSLATAFTKTITRHLAGVSALLLCLVAGWPAVAGATNSVADASTAQTEQVKVRLVPSLSQVTAGSRLTIGLQQVIIENWHTYWKNPGDSGNATTIDWQLPPSASASDIAWPTPDRTIVGPITNYSYSDEVTLLSDITLPADLTPGQPVQLTAVVDWLVCAEECIPQNATLTLTLPVGNVSIAAPPSELAVLAQAEARLPVAAPFAVAATAKTDGYQLSLPWPDAEPPADIYFYPAQWGLLAQSQPQPWRLEQQQLVLDLPAGEVRQQSAVSGVLVIKQAGLSSQSAATPVRGYQLDLPLAASTASEVTAKTLTPTSAEQTDSTAQLSLWLALLLAVGGGLILNLMPCVFPVLSIKALALLSHQQQSAAVSRRHGWVYTAGVVSSFVAFAGLILLLRQTGELVGWGFQFQSPVFVLLIATLLFAVGLSLSGVFTIGSRLSGAGQQLTEGQSYSASFFTGVLATVVATPCTAPLMAAALGFALTQPWLPLLLVFTALGLGLALPILLLSYSPALQRWLPKPGRWMEQFKQLLAFPIYAAVIWLVWVFTLQTGADGTVLCLGFLLLTALAAWWYQQSRFAAKRWRLTGTVAATVIVLGLIVVSPYAVRQLSKTDTATAQTSAAPPTALTLQTNTLAAEPYSEARLQALLAEGKAVFVNFTAAWCVSCLANEKVALSTDTVRDHFASQGIVYLKADWTKRDDAIRQNLQQHGRSGVPLYLFYPAGQTQPRQLPQLLTADLVVSQTQ